jgi:hypothetical protein
MCQKDLTLSHTSSIQKRIGSKRNGIDKAKQVFDSNTHYAFLKYPLRFSNTHSQSETGIQRVNPVSLSGPKAKRDFHRQIPVSSLRLL